jgi:preprotein translocase subunit SecG
MLMLLKVLLMLVEIVAGGLLIGVILLQKSKDEGLGLAFGVGMGETLFGSRAGNVLTKITIGLATVFLVNTVLLGILYARGRTSSLVDRLPSGPAAPAQAPAPFTPSPEQAAPFTLETVPPAGAPAAEAPAPAPVPEAAPTEAAPAPAPVPATP